MSMKKQNTNKINTLELLQDISKVTKAIDNQTDAFLVSRLHSNPKVRKLADESYEKKKIVTKRIAKEMVKKYE